MRILATLVVIMALAGCGDRAIPLNAGRLTTAMPAAAGAVPAPLMFPCGALTLSAFRPARSCTVSERHYTGVFKIAAHGCEHILTVQPMQIPGPRGTVIFEAVSFKRSSTCVVAIHDGTGQRISLAFTVVAVGPLAFSTPTFAPAGQKQSGTCNSRVEFTGVGQTATILLDDPGNRNGVLTLNLTSGNSPTAVASVSMSSKPGDSAHAELTVTAEAAGTMSFDVGDGYGHTKTCKIGVTTSTGTVS